MENSSDVEVREASLDDINPTAELLKEFVDDSLAEYGVDIDIAFAEAAFVKFIDHSFVLYKDNKVIGLLAGQPMQNILSQTKVFQEQVWFVSKEHRKHGIKLLKESEKKLKERGFSGLIMGLMENSRAAVLKKFYTRMGYSPMESHFLKQL